jgi:hypothetical protein
VAGSEVGGGACWAVLGGKDAGPHRLYIAVAPSTSVAPNRNDGVADTSWNSSPDSTDDDMMASEVANVLRMLSAYLCQQEQTSIKQGLTKQLQTFDEQSKQTTRQTDEVTILDHNSDDQSAKGLQYDDKDCPSIISLEETVLHDLQWNTRQGV